MSRALWIVVAAAVAYAGWLALLFAAQRALLDPGRFLPAGPPRSDGLPPRPGDPDDGAGPEAWALDVGGEEVEAWYHAPSPGDVAGPAVIFFHGNGERIDDWAGAFHGLVARGVAVVVVEYPGYGRSGGRPSEGSITETAVRAYDRLVARPEVDPDRVVGLGRSLGGGAIMALSRERALAAVVLQSTFTDVRRFARRYLAPGFLVRDTFDNLGAVEAFSGPVLVVHGTEDRLVPVEHGRALAAAAPRGRLVTHPCAHNDCPPDWDLFLDRVAEVAAGETRAPVP